jgi:hypothetical protein
MFQVVHWVQGGVGFCDEAGDGLRSRSTNPVVNVLKNRFICVRPIGRNLVEVLFFITEGLLPGQHFLVKDAGDANSCIQVSIEDHMPALFQATQSWESRTARSTEKGILSKPLAAIFKLIYVLCCLRLAPLSQGVLGD